MYILLICGSMHGCNIIKKFSFICCFTKMTHSYSPGPVQVIDLTDSFTLADHAALSNIVIEINDSINEPDNSLMSRTTAHHETDSAIEVADLTMTSDLSFSHNEVGAAYHQKKSKNAKKKKEQLKKTRNEVGDNQVRERSPLRSEIGDCPICYDRIGTKPLAATKCGHVFCQQCLVQALLREKRCPTCRQTLYGKTAYHPLFLGRG